MLLSVYCSDASLQDQLVTMDPNDCFSYFLGAFWNEHVAQLARGLQCGRWLGGPVLPYLAGQLRHLGGQSDVWAVGQRTSSAGLLTGLVTVADLISVSKHTDMHSVFSLLVKKLE